MRANFASAAATDKARTSTTAAAAAMATAAVVAATTAAAAAAAAEDLRFGGCGEKFDRFRMFLVVFGRFWLFPGVF